jgi:hypothetical protein
MENFSQAGQDKFILSILQNKKNGKYIEIGSFDPVQISNTYMLEKYFSWKGFSLDIISEYVDKFNSNRINKCICADGTTFNYDEQIQKMWGNIDRIDYLQVDCEPAENTYKCLCAVPLDKYRFSVITFETDYYTSGGGEVRRLSREKLLQNGYKLVASDVCNEGNAFEDWYVDPSYVSEEIYKKFICENKEGKDIC